jgi:hypothetical protein
VNFSQGDCVEWDVINTWRNARITLHGIIVAVVPAGEHPRDVVPLGYTVRPDLGGIRRVESYLIISHDSSYGRSECMWPFTGKLRLTKKVRSCI